MDVLEILENHEARLRRLTKHVEELILNGGGGSGGGLLVFSGVVNFPNPGSAGVIYLDDITGLTYYWDGTQYVPFIDNADFIQNQNAVNQAANFRIAGTGAFTTSTDVSLDLTQTAAGKGVSIPFHTPNLPNGELVLGNGGDSKSLLVVGNGTANSYFEAYTGRIVLSGIDPNPSGGKQSLFIMNDLWFFKNYGNNFFNTAVGPESIGIYDNTYSAMRWVIKPNGNMIVGQPPGYWPQDRGGRLNVQGGTLSLDIVDADHPGNEGHMFYRLDLSRARLFQNGAWRSLAVLDDVANKADKTVFKFIPSSPYTVLDDDDGKILVWGSAGPLTINMATGLRSGWQVEIWQDGGTITFADAPPAAVHSRGELKSTAGQYAVATLCHLVGGQFRLAGDLV